MDSFIGENGILRKYTGKESVVRIPEGYTRICTYAFKGTDPEIIIVPASVSRIDANAFYVGEYVVGKYDSGEWIWRLKEIHIEGEEVETYMWSFASIHAVSFYRAPRRFKLYVKAEVFRKLDSYYKQMIARCYLEDGVLTTDLKTLRIYINRKNNFEKFLKDYLRHDDSEALSRLISGKRISQSDADKYNAWATKAGSASCKAVLLKMTVTKPREEDPLREMTISDYRELFRLPKTDGQYSVTAYKGTDQFVTIPGEILGTAVISIGNEAFSPYQRGISEEQKDARLNRLEEVVVGNGIASIEGCAFDNCRGLKKVELPDSLRTIGWHAFAYCSGLTEINISEDVVLGKACFVDCPGLQDKDGMVIFNGQMFGYYGDEETVVIPHSVTEICSSVFKYNKHVKSIVLPPGLKYIEGYSFSDCEHLESIIIPSEVTGIGESAFWKCVSLKEIALGANVETVGKDAFTGCSGLEKVVFCGDTKIEKDAFRELDKVIIYAPKGSRPARYAKRNGIRFEELQ